MDQSICECKGVDKREKPLTESANGFNLIKNYLL